MQKISLSKKLIVLKCIENDDSKKSLCIKTNTNRTNLPKYLNYLSKLKIIFIDKSTQNHKIFLTKKGEEVKNLLIEFENKLYNDENIETKPISKIDKFIDDELKSLEGSDIELPKQKEIKVF